ncbi:MAG: LacI family DNA-binding transcriptional regulator [Pseudomonadota bacterium]
MMPGKVTSLEVAERAGVSRSAVSRVFTPGASVSEKTAQKVRQAASELGYRPNVLARSLLTGKSRIVGLVVAYLDNHFYPSVLEKLSNALQARGYHVLVFMASEIDDDLDRVTQEILDYQVDALVLASVPLSSDMVERCEGLGVPVVLFNRRQETGRGTSVTSNNREGGRLAAELFLRTGHTRIAHLAGSGEASTQRDREAGFLEGLQAGGVALAERAVGGFDRARTREAARAMFGKPDRPDAVFSANDVMAFLTMDVLRFELGLRVPEDVAVIGFDDVPEAAWPSYDLTTLRQDADAMVAATVGALMQVMVNGADTMDSVELPVRLMERGSTRGV